MSFLKKTWRSPLFALALALPLAFARVDLELQPISASAFRGFGDLQESCNADADSSFWCQHLDDELTLITSNERRQDKGGFTLWFTGLSGSGKSTLAEQLVKEGDNVEVGAPIWVLGDFVLSVLPVSLIFTIPWALLASVKTSPEIFGSPWSLPADFQWSNFARAWDKDPRHVEVVLRETTQVVRMERGLTQQALGAGQPATHGCHQAGVHHEEHADGRRRIDAIGDRLRCCAMGAFSTRWVSHSARIFTLARAILMEEGFERRFRLDVA